MFWTIRHSYVAVLFTLMLLCTSQPPNLEATPLDLPDVPLVALTSVSPNIMLLLDTSGSMNNIIPESPYDPHTTYFTCPPSSTIVAGDTIDILITSNGEPYFRQNGTDYDWNTSGEAGSHGPGRCFDSTQSYTARLYANQGSAPALSEGYAAGKYTGNYMNWYFGTSPSNWGSGARNRPGTVRRLDIAKNVAQSLVSTMHNVRVGIATLDKSNGAAINLGIEDLDASHKTTLLNVINTFEASGSTPLAKALQDIGRYLVQGYDATLTLHPGDPARETTKSAYTVFDQTPKYASGVSQQSPIQYFCQQNFALLLSDGRPQGDQDISASCGLQDYDGDCPNGNDGVTCLDYDRKVGRTYDSDGSDYVDDIARAMYEIDLRPDLDDYEGNEVTNNVITYTIGFADDQVIHDPLMQDTATNGGGLFLIAENASQLLSAFQSALADIQGKVGSAASVTMNSGALSTDTRLYQTRFSTLDWSGQLLSVPLNPDGSIQAPEWNARAVLDGQDFETGRIILTYNPVTTQGIPFRWGDLDNSQQTLLHTHANAGYDGQGIDRLAYLRGSAAHESTGHNYRTRQHRLGDLVNSGPFFVGAPAFPDTLGSGYAAFRSANSNRTPIVYVGGNDGMLHGFDATTGQEKLAYIPNEVFAHLSYLTAPNYTHRPYVDGSPTVGDAYGNFNLGLVSRCLTRSPCWRTILVGGLRGGGQGFFALDVTDPAQFDESNAAELVLWEFTDADDVDLGYTYSQPSIVRMANGKWAAVIGNGYNSTENDGPATSSTTGHAVLYILFLEGGLDGVWTAGTDYIKLDTGIGDPDTPNGLATPAPVDLDGDFTADYVYAGDQRGNLWKFDVSDPDSTNWRVAYSSPLFTAIAGDGTPQPITARPEAGFHPQDPNGLLVYFGTGKYLETGDKNVSGVSTQTFYAIWDKNLSTLSPFTRSALVQQEVIAVVSGHRITSDHAIDWGNHRGWYLDLPTAGERQVSNPLLRNNRVIFTTLIPNNQICGTGGTGWLMELNAHSGSRLPFSPFDLNGDDEFDAEDMVTTTLVGNEEPISVSGLASIEGILSSPMVLSAGKTELKYNSGSSGGVFMTTENPGPGAGGRQAWRPLP